MSSPTPRPAPDARIAIAMQAPQMRRLLALILRWHGYEPHQLEAGEGTLETLVREPFAAAIVDAHLAPLDGFTICSRVRAATSTPVILVVPLEEPSEHLRACEAGANAVLPFPFDLSELLASVASVLHPAGAPQDQEGGAQGTPDAADAGEAAPFRVLVAAAARSVRATLRAILEAACYEVVEATDGFEIVDLLLASPTPLVVVLDLLLPKLSGHRVLLHASVHPLLLARHAYVVLTPAGLPAERLSAQVAAMLTEQAIPVLQWPISSEQVLAAVGELRARLQP